MTTERGHVTTAATAKLDRDGAKILELAALAPSGHNTQPWRVHVHDEMDWMIDLDPMRTLPVVDPGHRESWLSIGAFCENLERAARQLGYRAEFDVRGDLSEGSVHVRLRTGQTAGGAHDDAADDAAEDAGEAARSGDSNPASDAMQPPDAIRSGETGAAGETGTAGRTQAAGDAGPADIPASGDAGVLRARRTVRNGFSRKPLRNDTLEKLLHGIPGVRFIAKDSDEGRSITEAVSGAVVQQNGDDAAMRELSEWIHWKTSEAEQRRDGLTPATMDIDGIAGLIARLFFSRKTVMGKSFRGKAVDIAREQLAQHGGWLLVSADCDALGDIIGAGRRYEQLGLRCREHGVAIHPMSQPLEEEPWSGDLRETLGMPRLQFILRAGYIDEYPAPVSLRRPLADFVTAA